MVGACILCAMSARIGEESEGRRGEFLALAALVGATVLVSLPILGNLSQQYMDFGPHLEFTRSLIRTGETSLPHFVFQYGVTFLFRLGLGLGTSAVALCLVAMVATTLVLYRIFRNETRTWLAALLSLAMGVIGPLSLVTLAEQELYLGYITPNTYHNPTLILLKPTALGLMWFGLRAFDPGVSKPRWGLVGAAAFLSVLSCITKPSFQIAFLPGLGLLTALALVSRREVDLRLCVLGIALPSFGVLGWQYLANFSDASAVQIIFSPLGVLSRFSDQLFMKLVLSLTFPLALTLTFFPQARREPLLQIAWSTAFFGLLYSYFLAESGERFIHGNFLWSGYIAIFALYAASLVVLLRQEKGRGMALCWAVFGLHVISGAIFAGTQALGKQYVDWW